MPERCICCGEIIPEGRQVRPNCVANSKTESQELLAVFEILQTEYERARKQEWIRDPLAFALLRAWKTLEERKESFQTRRRYSDSGN